MTIDMQSDEIVYKTRYIVEAKRSIVATPCLNYFFLLFKDEILGVEKCNVVICRALQTLLKHYC